MYVVSKSYGKAISVAFVASKHCGELVARDEIECGASVVCRLRARTGIWHHSPVLYETNIS
jgi:hypothetical protein